MDKFVTMRRVVRSVERREVKKERKGTCELILGDLSTTSTSLGTSLAVLEGVPLPRAGPGENVRRSPPLAPNTPDPGSRGFFSILGVQCFVLFS
jgi:hypothetical protein